MLGKAGSPIVVSRILCVLVFALTPFVVIESTCALQDDLVDLEKQNTQEVTTPLLTPEQAVKSWRLPKGFRVNLFAHEPDVHQPIAMAFDERGRLWVVENYTYSDNVEKFSKKLKDRVVIFEDEDQDGKFDTRKVFWDQGNKLTGIELGRGGVFLMGAPEFVFIADADGDDVPDGPPTVLLDGFDDDVIRHNIVNGLRWGPDGWLYSRHGILTASFVGQPGETQSQRTRVNCCIWRYHPDSKAVEVVAEGGTNPWGFDFDQHGEMFMINTVIGHLFHVVPGARMKRMYGSHFNPYTFQYIEQTADHYHWETSEPWTAARKALKGEGDKLSDGTDAAGGGHAHCGLMIYQGDNWPSQYRHQLFTLNFHGKRMNQESLVREGNSYVGKHDSDVCFTDDPWFRGIELGYGPDGTVFVLDWSDLGECHERDGIHRTSGRVYRIAYGAVAKPAISDLGKLNTSELINLLGHKNQYFARTARRVLADRSARGDSIPDSEIARLKKMAAEGPHQLEAIWTLESSGNMTGSMLQSLLASDNEHARVWALRLMSAEDFQRSDVNRQLATLTKDESGLVRLYLASAMSRMSSEQKFAVVTSLASVKSDAEDRTMPHMLWYGIEPDVTSNFESSMNLLDVAESSMLRRNIVQRLISDPDKGTEMLQEISGRLNNDQQAHKADLVVGVHLALDGRRKMEKPDGWSKFANAERTKFEADVEQRIEELNAIFGEGQSLKRLEQIALDRKAETSRRKQAIATYAMFAEPEDVFEVCRKTIRDRSLGSVVVKALAVCKSEDASQLILKEYARMDEAERIAAVDTLTCRESWAMRLLKDVEDKKIDRGEISAWHARQIQNLGSEELNEKLAAVWGKIRNTDESRKQQIESLRGYLTEEKIAAADMGRGKLLFEKNCGTCHVLFGKGKNIGPDLTGGDRKNLNYLLENIVDPGASIAQNFRSSILALEDGRVINGVVTKRLNGIIHLQTKDEVIRIPESEVEEQKETELSLMPNQLLDTMTDDEKADLFGWIMSNGS